VKLVHEDVRARMTAMVTQVERYALQKFYEDLLMTREAVLKINANISLSLQALLLSLRLHAAGSQWASA
jgi:hypothetical protein